MFKAKTKIEAPSTSFNDASKKQKKIRAKQSSFVQLTEIEAQNYQTNDRDDKDVSITLMTTDEEFTKKTESLSTPKHDERNISDMDTPEIRTQTRLTLKYDDLLLSQAIDPQSEVSWECISPEVVQKIHKDIQRKPNLDIGKILALIADEDETPSNSSSNINNIFVNTKPYLPSIQQLPIKRRRKLSSRNKTTSDMEEMIKKLEMQIENEAKEKLADDSTNLKSITDSLEAIKQPLQYTSSKSEGHNYSNKNLTKCLRNVSEPTFSGMKKNAAPVSHSSDSCMVNNEETSWSDDDLFCDESFMAKVTQSSENKMDEKKPSPVDVFNKKLGKDEKTSLTCCKTSSLGLQYTNKQKETKTESREFFLKKHSNSLHIIDADYMARNHVEKKSNDTGMNDNLDIDFSDSDTDELLSQLTEQEISFAIQSSTKKDCLVTQKTSAENFTDLPGVIGNRKTDKKNTVIEKASVDSYLEFLDISSSCRKPSPEKSLLTASSKKHKVYSFKSTKNNKKLDNISSTFSTPSKLNDFGPASLQNSFDDTFSDKDDDFLKFAESLDHAGCQFKEAITDVKKKSLSDVVTSKVITSKAKKLICSKEEIERKKREALNRRRKFGAVTKNNMK